MQPVSGSASVWRHWSGCCPAAVVLALAAGLVAAVWRWVRTPFRAAAQEMEERWSPLLVLPGILLVLHSYFLSSVSTVTELLLLLLTALAALWTMVRLMNSLAVQREAREFSAQMEALRRDYELLQRKLELGVALANTLENAIHACQAQPEDGPRTIRLELALTGRRLTLHVENSCAGAVEFDEDGFPAGARRPGHGQGLRSIAAVVKKYHGVFQCGWADGTFSLWAVLLDTAEAPRRVRRAPAVCAGVLLTLFVLNCMPTLAQALETVPVLGQVIRVVDLRSYSWLWGDTGVTVEEPVLDGDQTAVDAVEAKKAAFIAQMQDTFAYHAARKYQGYVSGDVGYKGVGTYMLTCCICDNDPKDLAAIRAMAEDFSAAHPEFALALTAVSSPYDLLERVETRGGFDLLGWRPVRHLQYPDLPDGAAFRRPPVLLPPPGLYHQPGAHHRPERRQCAPLQRPAGPRGTGHPPHAEAGLCAVSGPGGAWNVGP